MRPRLSLVVAIAKNGVIGADGGLAWKISDDLKWFKSVTMNKPMIMGRKTFDSIGKALPGLDNIVVTRSTAFMAEGGFVTRSIESSLKLGEACAKARDAEDICIIGGAEIYAQTIARARRIYLTRVDAEVKGDAFFPAIDSALWREEKVSICEQSAANQYACEFFILDRKSRI